MPSPGSQMGDQHRHRWIPILCGVALTALIGVGTIERSPAIEKHLKNDIDKSVLVDLPTVEVFVSGRDVTLVGWVDSPEERSLIASQIRQRWGVRSVNVDSLRATVVSTVPPTLQSRGGTGPQTATSTVRASSATTTSATPTTTVNRIFLPASTLALPAVDTPTVDTPTVDTPTVVPIAVPSALIPPSTVPVTVALSAAQKALVESTISEILRTNPIVFARNVPTLGLESRLAMDPVAALLKANPDVVVEIRSYTDNRGNPANNRKLSELRANTIRVELTSRDVDPLQIQAVGLGEADPIATNATEAGRQKNRRVEIVVVG